MTNRFPDLLANKAPVANHKPWPRYEVDPGTWTAIGEALGGGNDLLALWGDVDTVHLALRAPHLSSPCVVSVRVKDGAFPSIGRFHPPALRLERALHDLSGVKPAGIPDQRPVARSWRLGLGFAARRPKAGRAA